MNEEKMAFGIFLVQTIAESCGLEFKGQISELERKIDRAVYAGTVCGAWVRFDEKGIRVGSIVEGSDAEFSERIDLTGVDISDEGAKILAERFWNTVDKINGLACDAWEEANWNDSELYFN
jgi:hypothetical protein